MNTATTAIDFNAAPEGLSAEGALAHETIMRILRARGMTKTGGCRSFYSPEQWRERGERYGTEASVALVIVYDGGDLRPFFNMDEAMMDRYAMHEQMREALARAGFIAEECTGWYSAVYPMK